MTGDNHNEKFVFWSDQRQKLASVVSCRVLALHEKTNFIIKSNLFMMSPHGNDGYGSPHLPFATGEN